MPDPSIVVRPARSGDRPALERILWDTFATTWRPQLSASAAELFRTEDRPAAFVAEHGLAFVVAECAGEVVGLIYWRNDFVHALHVRSDLARRGVGGALMDLAEGAMTDAGHRQARLETDTFNLASQAFYAARGYREADRYPDREWASGLTTLLLVKVLA